MRDRFHAALRYTSGLCGKRPYAPLLMVDRLSRLQPFVIYCNVKTPDAGLLGLRPAFSSSPGSRSLLQIHPDSAFRAGWSQGVKTAGFPVPVPGFLPLKRCILPGQGEPRPFLPNDPVGTKAALLEDSLRRCVSCIRFRLHRFYFRVPEGPAAGRLHRFRGIALPPVFLQNPVSDLRNAVFPEPFEAEMS